MIDLNLKDGPILGRHVVYQNELHILDHIDFNGGRVGLVHLKTGKLLKTPSGSTWIAFFDEIRDAEAQDYID